MNSKNKITFSFFKVNMNEAQLPCLRIDNIKYCNMQTSWAAS